MRYLSLFSGIEAATAAWHPLGWKPVAFAEIDPFPCAVLAHHYPLVPNLGDVTKITDEQIKALGRIDIVVGGSPCQDLSKAGKRKGLAGERSGLFYEQIRIFNAARLFCGARWFVWENVPGALYSNRGGDFSVIVSEMAGCSIPAQKEPWGTEGVAIGDRGLLEWCVLDAQWFGVAQRRKRVFAVLDAGDWKGRPPVLLESDKLRGDYPPGRDSRGHATATTYGGTEGADFGLIAHGIPATIICGKVRLDWGSARLSKNISPTLAKSGRHGVVICTDETDDTANNMADVESVLAGKESTARVDFKNCARRLTPLECERLQGFADDFTKIPWRNKPSEQCPDTPRYEALGNSMAVPVMRWIGNRIEAVDKSCVR